jgi:hypothetical protein
MGDDYIPSLSCENAIFLTAPLYNFSDPVTIVTDACNIRLEDEDASAAKTV